MRSAVARSTRRRPLATSATPRALVRGACLWGIPMLLLGAGLATAQQYGPKPASRYSDARVPSGVELRYMATVRDCADQRSSSGFAFQRCRVEVSALLVVPPGTSPSRRVDFDLTFDRWTGSYIEHETQSFHRSVSSPSGSFVPIVALDDVVLLSPNDLYVLMELRRIAE